MDATASNAREAVVFLLNGQRYALPIEAVQEIQQIVAMTDVTEASSGVIGMINLRGLVIPAVDLRRALGMEPRAIGLQTPMVIARVKDALVALVVDEVEDVAVLPAECIQEPGEYFELADRLIGVCRAENDLVFLLDPDRVLSRTAELPAAPDPPAAARKRRARKKAE